MFYDKEKREKIKFIYLNSSGVPAIFLGAFRECLDGCQII